MKSLNELDSRHSNMYYFLSSIASISDLNKLTWVKFYHLYEKHNEVITAQSQAIQ